MMCRRVGENGPILGPFPSSRGACGAPGSRPPPGKIRDLPWCTGNAESPKVRAAGPGKGSKKIMPREVPRKEAKVSRFWGPWRYPGPGPKYSKCGSRC